MQRGEATALQKARTTLIVCHHFWLAAAREALQGDAGKLRRWVAMAEGKTRDEIITEMERHLQRETPND